MHTHPMFRFLLLISLITGCVLLAFRYLLPLFLPFVTAYILIRLLFPLIHFLQKRLSFPKWLAYGGTLVIFFSLLSGALLLLGKYLIRQCRLLCTNVPMYGQICCQSIQSGCQKLCQSMDHYFRFQQGTTLEFINTRMDSISDQSMERLYQGACDTMVNWLGGSMHLLWFLLFTFIGMVILCKDLEPIHQAYRSNRFYLQIHQVLHTMRTTGLAYLRTQVIIVLIVWVLCGIGLCLIRNPYYIIIGLAIALVDALPALGSGTILVPWGLYYIFQRQFYPAAVLLTIYLATLFTREFLEARLMGEGLHLFSFFTLASIYAGLKLYGICGIFLGPFSVVLIRAIYQVWTGQDQVSPTDEHSS